MSIHVANQLNIKVIDSFNHLPMSFIQTASRFWINRTQKCYFPHLFNRGQNQNYVGPYLDAKFHSPEFMTADNATYS